MNQISLELPASSSQGHADLPLPGMHCAVCATRIEKALNGAEGVAAASVNYATTRASVQFDPAITNPLKRREVVQDAGYDAILPGDVAAGDKSLQDAEIEARAAEFAA
jgi:Cu+-exporting ATPase